MAGRGVRRSRGEEEEESYFVSMADMMVGLVFVFLILLLYFALQFRQETSRLDTDGTRAQILRKLERDLLEQGLKVQIDENTGVLRLPENVLFDTGQSVLKPEGEQAVAKLRRAMEAVLPCYTFPRKATCPPAAHHLDAIFVEGHTDDVAMRGSIDNLDLSVQRATNTYRKLLPEGSLLKSLLNSDGKDPQPVFSVSGYGPDRPVPNNQGTPEQRNANNRRIDLRFLMVTPRAPELTDMLVRR
jgi:flagellar motor protein MotB